MSIELKNLDYNWDADDGGIINAYTDGMEIQQEDGVLQSAKIDLCIHGPKYLAAKYHVAAGNWTLATKLAEKAARQDAYDYLSDVLGYSGALPHWDYDDGTMGPPLHLVAMSSVSEDTWKAECTFEYPSYTTDDGGQTVDPEINSESYVQPELQENSFEYSSTGENAHIIKSIATIGTYSPQSWTAPNYNGMIGWNGTEFEGCDVIRPALKFSCSVNRPYGLFNASQRLLLAGMVGYTNIAPFMGFPAGCVLFDSFSANIAYLTATVSGRQVKQPYWRCTYSWQAMPAATIGDETTSITKGGFDYAWEHKQTITASDGNEGSICDGIYVEQVYPRADFTRLGLLFPV